MSAAWEQIGVQTVLDIGEAKAKFMATTTETAEHWAALDYINVLEAALDKLGIHIHENGAVSPTSEGVVHT